MGPETRTGRPTESHLPTRATWSRFGHELYSKCDAEVGKSQVSEPVRILFDPESGERYQVRLTPHELPAGGGVTPAVNSVVFETETGEWIGAVPMFSLFWLGSVSEGDLKEMLHQVKQTER